MFLIALLNNNTIDNKVLQLQVQVSVTKQPFSYVIGIWSLYYSVVNWQWFFQLSRGKCAYSKQKKESVFICKPKTHKKPGFEFYFPFDWTLRFNIVISLLLATWRNLNNAMINNSWMRITPSQVTNKKPFSFARGRGKSRKRGKQQIWVSKYLWGSHKFQLKILRHQLSPICERFAVKHFVQGFNDLRH